MNRIAESIDARLNPATAALLLAALSIGIGIYPLIARPDITAGTNFLFSDEGHALLAASVTQDGGQLYRDLYSPYGPLPSSLWTIVAHVAGNTPTAFGALQGALNVVVMLLVFGVLRRWLSASWALAFAVVCVLPSVMIRGQIYGGYWANVYSNVERVIIAALFLAWRPPTERSAARSVALGALLGSLQWIKFGTATFIGAGFVAAEVIAWWQQGASAKAARQFFVVIAVAAAMEAAFVLWAVASLPWLVARDVIWPSFGMRMYLTPLLDVPRFPPFAPQVFLFRRDAAVLCGFILGALVLWQKRRSPQAPVVSLWLGAYVVGSVGLFRHVYHYYGYAWMLTTLVGITVAGRSTRFRLGTLLFCAPVLAYTLRTLMLAPPAGEWITSPQTGSFYLTRDAADDIRAVNALSERETARGGQVLALGAMSGWYAAFGHAQLYRQTWMLPGWVRPWEAADAERAWSRASAMAVCGRDDGSLRNLALDPDVESFFATTFPVATPLTSRCTAYTRTQ